MHRALKRKIVTTASVVLLLSGCTSYTVNLPTFDGAAPGGTPTTVNLRSSAGSVGFGDRSSAQVGEICRDGHLASVQVRQNTGQLLLTFVTLGLYAPAQAEYFCTKEKPEGQ